MLAVKYDYKDIHQGRLRNIAKGNCQEFSISIRHGVQGNKLLDV